MLVSSSIADARAWSSSVLSFARWIAAPVSFMPLPIPVAASPTRTCASAAEYCAFSTSFCERNASMRVSSCCCAVDELVLLVGEPLHLRVHALELLLRDRLALERLLGEVVAVRRDRLPSLRLELDDVLLELLLLELEPLLRRDDVGDAALDVLELLEHLLVRVVERLGRVLRPVEELRVLRLDDERSCGT